MRNGTYLLTSLETSILPSLRRSIHPSTHPPTRPTPFHPSTHMMHGSYIQTYIRACIHAWAIYRLQVDRQPTCVFLDVVSMPRVLNFAAGVCAQVIRGCCRAIQPLATYITSWSSACLNTWHLQLLDGSGGRRKDMTCPLNINSQAQQTQTNPAVSYGGSPDRNPSTANPQSPNSKPSA